ncbi:hypothetical protein AYI70_g2895, partial [Smittium culicis]
MLLQRAHIARERRYERGEIRRMEQLDCRHGSGDRPSRRGHALTSTTIVAAVVI